MQREKFKCLQITFTIQWNDAFEMKKKTFIDKSREKKLIEVIHISRQISIFNLDFIFHSENDETLLFWIGIDNDNRRENMISFDEEITRWQNLQ